ncbi:MAG: restriction endonuclease, partial [Gammaproteobacteria bacterium]
MNLSDNAVGYAIAVVVITALVQKVLATMRHGHWGNILRSRRVLKQLIRLGAEENGSARQFGFMRRIDPFLFEEVILTALKRAGHRIQRNARYTGDGGIDGQCWIRGEHYLIQVKRYSSHINPRQVNDFVQLCRARRA